MPSVLCPVVGKGPGVMDLPQTKGQGLVTKVLRHASAQIKVKMRLYASDNSTGFI